MKVSGLLAGVLFPVIMAVNSHAQAAIVPITITGTNENINDVTGVFGEAGERITNQPFTETFSIDTAVGTFAPPTPTSASYNSIFGAPGTYAVAASLTIDGHTFSTQGDDYSSAFITPGSGASPTTYTITSDDKVAGLPESQFNENFYLDLDGPGLPQDLTQDAVLSGVGSSSAAPYVIQTSSGSVSVLDTFIDGLDDADGKPIVDSQGDLYPTSIHFGEVSAVPEPSAWLLMIAGFGSLGVMLRKSKRRHGFSTAKRAIAA